MRPRQQDSGTSAVATPCFRMCSWAPCAAIFSASSMVKFQTAPWFPTSPLRSRRDGPSSRLRPLAPGLATVRDRVSPYRHVGIVSRYDVRDRKSLRGSVNKFGAGTTVGSNATSGAEPNLHALYEGFHNDKGVSCSSSVVTAHPDREKAWRRTQTLSTRSAADRPRTLLP